MTANELTQFVGKKGVLRTSALPGLEIGIDIQDAKVVFGKVQLLVTPLIGGGRAWVSAEKVEVER